MISQTSGNNLTTINQVVYKKRIIYTGQRPRSIFSKLICLVFTVSYRVGVVVYDLKSLYLKAFLDFDTIFDNKMITNFV